MQIKTITIFIVVTLGVLLGVGGLLWQFGEAGNKPIEGIAGEMRHKKGAGSVVITEFSDFQCPACAAVHQPLQQLLAKYEGKVTFVYRNFPLTSIHKNAMIAAQAAEAAGLQNKFFEYGDLLFAKQDEWANLSDPKEAFRAYALLVEIDLEQFISDMESEEVKNMVAGDLLDSTRYQLKGTPTFFVDGVKVEFGQIEARIQELGARN